MIVVIGLFHRETELRNVLSKVYVDFLRWTT